MATPTKVLAEDAGKKKPSHAMIHKVEELDVHQKHKRRRKEHQRKGTAWAGEQHDQIHSFTVFWGSCPEKGLEAGLHFTVKAQPTDGDH